MGLKCPKCHGCLIKVTNTYSGHQFKWRGRTKTVIRRRRECEHCFHSWYTVEQDEADVKDAVPKPADPSPTADKPLLFRK